MNEQEFLDFATSMCKEYGLPDYRVQIVDNFGNLKVAEKINKTIRLADCTKSLKRIRFNRDYVQTGTQAQLFQTIIHEIAHALCSNYAGHGPEWKAKMVELGVPPIVRGHRIIKQYWYPQCGLCHEFDKTKKYQRYTRKTKSKVCPNCGGIGDWSWTGGREVVAEVK